MTEPLKDLIYQMEFSFTSDFSAALGPLSFSFQITD
jgi:hypothetical protein